jgi:hypothetical protein
MFRIQSSVCTLETLQKSFEYLLINEKKKTFQNHKNLKIDFFFSFTDACGFTSTEIFFSLSEYCRVDFIRPFMLYYD